MSRKVKHPKTSVLIGRSRYLRLTFVGIICTLCGCASLTVSKLPPNARYTVITHFEDGIYYGKTGTTIFNDDYRVEHDTADVSTPIKNKIIEVLNADSAKQYVPVNFSFPVPAWTDNSDTYVSNVKADCILSDQDKATLEAIAKEKNLNLIIFVCDGAYTIPYQFFPGRGLSLRQIFGTKMYSTFFNYSIDAYDPRTWDSVSYHSAVIRPFEEFGWPTKNAAVPDDIKAAVRHEVDSDRPPLDIGFGLCYLKLTSSGQQYLNEVRAKECNAKYPIGREVNNGLPIYWFPQLIPSNG